MHPKTFVFGKILAAAAFIVILGSNYTVNLVKRTVGQENGLYEGVRFIDLAQAAMQTKRARN